MASTQDSHPIVDRARGLLDRLSALEEVPAEQQPVVIRAKVVLEQLVVSVETANPLLLSIRALDSISDHLNEVETAIPVLEGNPTTATIGDFTSGVEEVLYRLSDLVHIQRAEDVGPVKAAIREMARFAENQIKTLEEQLDALGAQASDLGSRITAGGEKYDTRIEQLNQKLTELSAAVEVQKEELQTALTSQSSLFETEQEKRRTNFATTLKEISAEHDAAQADMIKKGEASVEEVHEKAETLLAQINKRKEEVEATAEAVGLTATISGFAKYADQQKKSADIWRAVVVVSLVLIAVLGLATLAWTDPETLTLQRSLLKGSVGTALAILAGYAGKQSGHHRREERRSRRLGLEVAAFDPYVANLAEDRQKELKEFMALRVFGHLEDPDTEDDRWGEHQPSARKVLDLLRRDKTE